MGLRQIRRWPLRQQGALSRWQEPGRLRPRDQSRSLLSQWRRSKLRLGSPHPAGRSAARTLGATAQRMGRFRRGADLTIL